MSVTSMLLENMQAQANIVDTRTQTQERLQKIQQNQLAMQNQQAMTDLMRKRAEQMVNGKPDAPEMLTMDDGTMVPADSTNPLLATLKNVKENVARAKLDTEDALFTGNFKTFQESEKELFSQQKEYRMAQKELMDDMKERAKQTSSTFGGVRTPEDVRNALAFTNDTISPSVAKKVAAQINKALPQGLDNASEAQIRAAVAPIANQFATQGDQMRAQSAKQASEDRAASLEERRRADDLAHADRTATQALTREGHDIQRERMNASKGVRDEKDIRKTEDAAQTALNKDPVVSTFWKVDKGYKAAENAINVLEKNGFRSVSPAEGRTLLSEYNQMVQNYRSQMASKWTDTQAKKFDSVFDKISASLQTVGKGDTPSPETLKTVAAEVKRMHDDMNVQVVKKTLQQRDKVWRRQGDPSIITSPGSIDKALHTPGVDMVVDDDGNKIMRFGPDKEDWMIVRDKPKKVPKASVYDDEDEE